MTKGMRKAFPVDVVAVACILVTTTYLFQPIITHSDIFGPVTVNKINGSSSRPAIALSSTNDIFVVWEDAAAGDILLAKSDDGGATFGSAVNVSNSTGNSVRPEIALSSTNKIFVVWGEGGDVLLAKSDDGGATFGSAVNVSNDTAFITEPEPSIATSSTNEIYVAWTTMDESTEIFEILLAKSDDGGATFGSAVNVSPVDSSESFQPDLILSSSDQIFVVWTDFSISNGDIFFAEVKESLLPSLTIVSIQNAKARWGLDPVIINGVANNAVESDSIIVDWGNGNLTTSAIDVSNDGSWTANHTYSSADMDNSPFAVVATLVDSGNNEKAVSTAITIELVKHTTGFVTSQIGSVKEGQNVTASGSLFDSSTVEETGISGKNITFTGTGAVNLSMALTDGNGSYVSRGPSADSPGDFWTVYAHFEGDNLYFPSDGLVETYNVVDISAAEFTVTIGSPSHVDLEGFNASVNFDNVIEPGKVYVLACDSPSSPRYIDLGICVNISPAAHLAEDSAAHIKLSYHGVVIPDGYTENDVGLFYNGPSGIIDTTESRDSASNEVIGKTTGFGKFIVGIVLHDPPAEGSIRQEVFASKNQMISPIPPVITLDKERYEMSDFPIITVFDLNANLDILSPETISVNVSSTTSAPDGITLDLRETDKDTGTFIGTFSFTGGSSSGASLEANDGDHLTVTYNHAASRFNATFDSIVEAGVVDISSRHLASSEEIIPFTSSFKLEFVDAQMAPDSDFTITMSYAGIDLNGVPPTGLKLFQKVVETAGDWHDITLDNGQGYDLDNKTITGKTKFLGTFVIACDLSSQTVSCSDPGGAGGGPVKSGIVVLDGIATVKGNNNNSNDNHSGGGSGGHLTVLLTDHGPINLLPQSYIEDHPLERIQATKVAFLDQSKNEVIQPTAGEHLSITGQFTNYQEVSQNYSFIVQIEDGSGVAIDIKVYEGVLESGQAIVISSPWMPEDDGIYTIKIFAWDNLSKPYPLSGVTVKQIKVA